MNSARLQQCIYLFWALLLMLMLVALLMLSTSEKRNGSKKLFVAFLLLASSRRSARWTLAAGTAVSAPYQTCIEDTTEASIHLSQTEVSSGDVIGMSLLWPSGRSVLVGRTALRLRGHERRYCLQCSRL